MTRQLRYQIGKIIRHVHLVDFDAAEALRIGFVNHVYPAGELQVRAAELAAEIAANGPLAVQAAKQSIDGTYWREREAWLLWEAERAVGPLLSEDRKADLSTLIVINYLLERDRLTQVTPNLTTEDRHHAKTQLESRRSALAATLREALRRAYGVISATDDDLGPRAAEQPVTVRGGLPG